MNFPDFALLLFVNGTKKEGGLNPLHPPLSRSLALDARLREVSFL